MKKFAMIMSIVLLFGLLAGCGGNSGDPAASSNNGANKDGATNGNNNNATNGHSAEGKYADGTYYAEDDHFSEKSGWKSVVVIQVKDGKIVDVNWTAASKDGGPDKKTASKEGTYGMVAHGGAQAEWHEQAEIMENYLIEKQDPQALEVNADGTIDAVSGVSITVNDFQTLAAKALAAGPSEPGPYKDGAYSAEADTFAEKSGWKETVDLTVIHGKIVAVNWNAVHKDGGDDKKTSSMNGEYGMKAGGAQSEWHEQAAIAEAYLLEKQDLAAFKVKDDGKTDAVSGVSVSVNGFTSLVEKALSNAQ